jgi:hypothetical protein
MHILYVLDFGSAAKITLFASDVEKAHDGLFQQPVRDRFDKLSANGRVE